VLRKDAKLELIRSVPLFAHCTKKELTAIASVADIVDVPAGQELVQEGDPLAREFMVIVDGAADVRRRGRRIATLGSGDFFGEMALLAHGPRSATVTSTQPSELLVVTPAAFHALLERLPSLQSRVLMALAQRLHANSV
jgi:CRP/FNR family transcriptional regulator, cyclic AMP receptor protein